MDRRRAMLWGLLACSTLFTLYSLWPSGNPVGTATTGEAVGAPPAVPPEPVAAATVVQDVPPIAPADFAAWRSRLGADRRDPFFTVAELDAMNRPAAAVALPDAPPPPPPRTVTLVMMSGVDWRALIDRQVVKVGDMLGDERVAAITSEAVVLEHEGRRRMLGVETRTATVVQVETERTR